MNTPTADPVLAAFVALGYFRARDPQGLTEAEATVIGGEVGAVEECARFAGWLTACEAQAARECDHNYPGVFCYEVAEPLGAYIREGHDESAIRKELALQCARFFLRDSDERKFESLYWRLLKTAEGKE